MHPPQLEAWRRAHTEALRSALLDGLKRWAASPAQHALLTRALPDFDRRDARSEPIAIAHHLPALIACALQGIAPDPAAPRVGLTLTTALLELGIDVLDHAADGELGGHWRDTPAAAVALVATGCIGSLPHLALAELGLSSERQALLHTSIARGLARLGAGQQRDFTASTAQDALAALDKTGERYGLYALMGAQASGADPQHAEAWLEYGRALGRARQLSSDCADLLDPDSRDLRSGVRTWPQAWLIEHAQRHDGPQAAAALQQLMRDAASGAPDAHSALRQTLLDRGLLRRAAWEIELHCQGALRALGRTDAHGPARDALRAVAVQASIGRPETPEPAT